MSTLGLSATDYIRYPQCHEQRPGFGNPQLYGGMDPGQTAGLQYETDRLRMASREFAEIAGGSS